MGQEPSEIRAGLTGAIYTAPVSTAFPTSVADKPSAGDGWIEHGLTTEDGVEFSFGRETTSIMSWQLQEAARILNTRRPKSVKFTLQQTNQHNLVLAQGGGTVTPGTGEWTYEPPDADEVDERAAIIEFKDGEYTHRIGFRRTQNMSGTNFSSRKDQEVRYPIELTVLGPDDGSKPYFWVTDDPNMGIDEAAS